MAEDKSYLADGQPVEDREQRKFVPDMEGEVAVNVVGKYIEFLLEQILDALDITPGESHFNSTQDTTDPGNFKTILTETVPVGKERKLAKVSISCRQEGVGYIYADGALIGSVLTGAAAPNGSHEWSPKYPVAAGLVIEVQFRARPNSPIVTVDCHLSAIDKTI